MSNNRSNTKFDGKNNKLYVVTISAIFLGQIYFASLFVTSLNGSELQRKEIALLQAHNGTLASQVIDLKKLKNRGIASIPSNRYVKAQESDLNFELVDHYLAQFEKLKSSDRQAALQMLEKLQSSTTNREYLARARYEKINLICDKSLEIKCMSEIDAIVSQFPESNWTARSLLLLSHFYYKQNRQAEAKSLIQVIKAEFKSYSELSQDIQKLAQRNQ